MMITCWMRSWARSSCDGDGVAEVDALDDATGSPIHGSPAEWAQAAATSGKPASVATGVPLDPILTSL